MAEQNRFDAIIDDSFTSDPLRATLSESMKESPDNRAKILDLSNKTGIPAEAVAPDVAGVEAQARFDAVDIKGMTLRSPVTSDFLSNYDNASVSHDDIENLEQTEHLFSGLGRVISLRYQDILAGTQLKAIEERQRLGIGRYLAAEDLDPITQDLIERNINATQDRTAELLEGIRQRGEDINALTPQDLNILEEGARAGVESLSVMLPALAIGAATRTGVTGVLSSIGVTTMGANYGSAREKGLDPDEALLYSQIQTVIEVGTELLPVKSLVDIVSSKTRSQLGKNVLQFIVREMGTEQLATLGQTITDYAFDLDEQLKAASSVGEMAAIQARRQAVTAIATIVGGGAQAGIAATINAGVQAVSKDEQMKDVKGEAEQSSIDDIVDLAEQSKVKDRSTETFRQFIEQAAPNDVVYIDGPQAALYLQEVGEVEGDPVLEAITKQIGEAAVTNGEVVIPVADFAADFVGSEHFEALRPHMTLSADTVSPFRAESEKEATENYTRRLVEEANENVSEYAENQAIFTNTVDQLVATGQVNKKAAKQMALIVPAWATVMSRHTGMPVAELYAKVGLTIEGPFEERKAAVAEGAAEIGLILDQQDFGDVSFDEQHTLAETGEAITVKRSAQRVFEQKRKQRTMTQNLLDCLYG